MVITDFLERNARLYGSDVALVEINPSEERDDAVTWRDYSLIESASPDAPYRREMTWKDFDRRANRFANLLLSRGLQRGTKVGILLMNCLEWLPLYFGILKAGCVAVPMNYRYSSEEIAYCLDLADVEVLVFGPEFVSRVDPIVDKITGVKLLLLCRPQGARLCGGLLPPGRVLLLERAPGGADRGGRRGDLFLLRHDRLPQGHPAQAPLAARRLPDRAASPRADPRRRVPVHPAALPHGRQDALVRQPGFREQGGAAARRQARMDSARGHRGEMHHRLAARAVVPGHPGGDRIRPHRPEPLHARSVAADAHRRAARAAQHDPPLAQDLPAPPVRHQLRPVRIHRPGLRPSGRGEYRQGRRDRQARLSVAGAHRGRRRAGRPPGRGGRADRQGPGRHGLLLQEPRGHGRGAQGRLAVYGRYGPHG